MVLQWLQCFQCGSVFMRLQSAIFDMDGTLLVLWSGGIDKMVRI